MRLRRSDPDRPGLTRNGEPLLLVYRDGDGYHEIDATMINERYLRGLGTLGREAAYGGVNGGTGRAV